MQDISLDALLKAGVHFGHRKSRWHPNMAPYIFTSRNDVYIIDLEKTRAALMAAMEAAKEIVQKGGNILFVGTKPQVKQMVRNAAQSCGMPYVTEKWLGGTLTNFEQITRLFYRLQDLRSKQQRGELAVYTKKEQMDFQKEIERLERSVGGIQDLKTLPTAMFVVDLRKERTAVTEARRKKIPIIGLVDTNVDPTLAAFPIPGNDDGTKSVQLIVDAIASAIQEGTEGRKAASVALGQPVPSPLPSSAL